MATIYKYQTGREVREATAGEYNRYMAQIAGDPIGAVDGAPYKVKGTIYMM